MGDGRVRAEHPGIHLHLTADSAHSQKAWKQRTGCDTSPSLAVLLTVIAVRFAWHMPFNAVVRWPDRRAGFHPPRPMLRPTIGSGLIISWAGMRGIVSLSAAMALPSAFPVARSNRTDRLLGRPLHAGDPRPDAQAYLRRASFHDDDPVGHELAAGA